MVSRGIVLTLDIFVIAGMSLLAATGCIPWKLPSTSDGGLDADQRADVEFDGDRATDADLDESDSEVDDRADADDDDADDDIEVCDPGSIPVFPGAVGYGTQTRAAYGDASDPAVCIVDTLEGSDELRPGTRSGVDVRLGTLEGCINWARDGKIIIFETSGTIDLPGSLQVDDDFVTIAGQTAPPPGIELRRSRLSISGHDVLVQHLAIRYGDDAPASISGDLRDALVIAPEIDDCIESGPHNVVVDHLSIAWAGDANVEIGSELARRRECVHDVTVSSTIIAEALNQTVSEVQYASRGLSIENGEAVALVRNIFHSNSNSNPRVTSGPSSGVLVNNLIYNARHLSIEFANILRPIAYSVVGNVNRPGPSAAEPQGCCRVASLYRSPAYYFDSDSRIHFVDNQCGVEAVDVNEDPTMAVQETAEDLTLLFLGEGVDASVITPTSPTVWPPCVEPLPSDEVLGFLLEHAGARPGERTTTTESVDGALIADIVDVEAHEDAHSPRPSWPLYEGVPRNVEHGMPDEIGPFPSDPHGDDDSDGYSNLEEWIHRCSTAVE